MTKNKMTAAEVTEAIIKEWKEKYDGVFKYQTSDGKTCYMRTPSRDEVEAAGALANKPAQSNTILAKACFLAGDEEILTTDKYFWGLSEKLRGIIKKVEGELQEL